MLKDWLSFKDGRYMFTPKITHEVSSHESNGTPRRTADGWVFRGYTESRLKEMQNEFERNQFTTR
jgi:hypothetical protein